MHGVVSLSPICERAKSCSCGDNVNDFKIDSTWTAEYTVGLYNECKCDFWLPLCEHTGVGEACDYAAEHCCGDYKFLVGSDIFSYQNSPTCYCDFFNFAQNEHGYALKANATRKNFIIENPCGQMEDWIRRVELDDEKASLEAIYNETNGPKWINSTGWMNETVEHCKWYGISCDNEGHITSIELRDNNLAGQFPVYTRQSKGDNKIVWEKTKYGLANLHYLERVDLGDNKLTGTIEYRPLYNLASLTHFDVSGNQLSGEISALVTPVLKHSDFSNNNFTSIRRFEKYKGSYLTLLYCDVSDNAIKVNAADRLENIPINIKQFFARNNQFYGSLPESMSNLPKLRQFSMSNNDLSGSLFESSNNLPQLRQFDISSNALSGQLPSFPESMLTLQELDLSNQKIGFTGSIPEDLVSFQSLKILNLSGNELKATIPPSIGNIALLEVLDLSNNRLTSMIPPELGLLEGECH